MVNKKLIITIISVDGDIVKFKVSEPGTYVVQLVNKGKITYEEPSMVINKDVIYFIRHNSVSNYGTILRVGKEEINIHSLPIINIITRASRPKLFNRCYASVINQSYKNINHIVTYETEELGNMIQQMCDTTNMSLSKVHQVKRLEGLYRSFTYKQSFKQSDIDVWDYKIWDGKEDTTNIYTDSSKGIRMKTDHFPYNSYLKVAERKILPGWVMYLDDDDILYDDSVIQLLVDNIMIHDEDTIHWFPCYKDNTLFPEEYILNHLRGDVLPAINCINSSCFLFHSKYIEYTAWDQWGGDDYRTAASLADKIRKNNSIYSPIVNIIDGSNHGKKR